MDESKGPTPGSGPPDTTQPAVVEVRPSPRSGFGTVLWLVAILLCYAGLWVTGALSQAHRNVPYGDKGLLASVCSPSAGEGVSCDQVLQSRWAMQWLPKDAATLELWIRDSLSAIRGTPPPVRGTEGWARLPVAWFGAAYFAAMGMWFLFVGQPSHSRRAVQLIPLLIVGVALIGSARFMYILLFRLPAICPLCVMTHAINLLLFVAAVLLWPKRPRETPGVIYTPRPSWKQVVTTLVLMFFVVQVVIVNQAGAQGGADVAAYAARLKEYEDNSQIQAQLAKDKLSREIKHVIPVDSDDPIRGSKDARRTFVLFSDFQCPSCKALHEHLDALWPQIEMAAAPVGGIRLIYKHYPLYSPCNARAGTNMHAYSCDAAKAAEAARIVGGPGAFWQMVRLLYKNQQNLDLAEYAKYAEELGLDVPAFEKARRSPEAAERVSRHVREGWDAGMSSTPGLYLDGVRVTEFGRSGPGTWGSLFRMPVWPPSSAPAHPTSAPSAAAR